MPRFDCTRFKFSISMYIRDRMRLRKYTYMYTYAGTLFRHRCRQSRAFIPAADTLDIKFAVFIIPTGTPISSTLGGPLPVYATALVSAIFPAGYSH